MESTATTTFKVSPKVGSFLKKPRLFGFTAQGQRHLPLNDRLRRGYNSTKVANRSSINQAEATKRCMFSVPKVHPSSKVPISHCAMGRIGDRHPVWSCCSSPSM